MSDIVVSSGITSTFIALSKGDVMSVYGSAVITTVSSGGSAVVLHGGTALSTAISNGGFEQVSSGGAASFTTVSNGGSEDVASGGRAVSTTVSDGGYQIVSSGGTITSTALTFGGTELVSGGTASFTVVSDGGYAVVSSGGTTLSTTLDFGGSEVESSGGTASFTVVSLGATETTSAGGADISATVSFGGTESVTSGGVASFTVLSNGGAEYVYSRGTASFTTVGNGGSEFVSSAGSAIGATVGSGGNLFVYSGAAGFTTVNHGGTEFVFSGGSIGGANTIDGQLTAIGGLTLDQSGGVVTVLAVTSGGTVSDDSGMIVGSAGSGSVSITAGGTVSASTLDIGVQSTGVGTVTVSGDNARLITSGSLAVGDAGSGVLQVLNGATVSIGGDLDIASTGGSGTIDIDGSVAIGGNIDVGTGAAGLTVALNGTLTQANGGVVAGSNFVENVYGTIAQQFSGGGNVNIHTTGTVAYPAYVADTMFDLDPGVAFTLAAPTIYGATDLNVGQTGDAEGSELILNAGTFAAASSVTFNDAMSTLVIGIDNLATISVPSSGTSGFSAEANPGLGGLLLSAFGGTIEDFRQGDTILVDTHLSSASAGTLSQNGAVVSVIEIANSATLGVLTFDSAANAVAAVADNAIQLVPCFAAGTRIATDRGEIAVEAIGIGERVRVLLGGGPAGDGFAPVIWVGRREVDCAGHRTPRKVWPVRVSAGAFGVGRPGAELFLSPDHAVYVEGVLIPVRYLINGSTIVQVPVARVTYHHVELAVHDVLLAEGLPAESFLDMRDGTNYANRSGSVRLYPDFSARMWEGFGCARLVVTGPELEAARALTRAFAVGQSAAA